MGQQDFKSYLATITKIDKVEGSVTQTIPINFKKTICTYDIVVPKKGERYYFGNLLTSTVLSVDLPLFATKNSVYHIEWLPYEGDSYIGSSMVFYSHNDLGLSSPDSSFGPFDFEQVAEYPVELSSLPITLSFIKHHKLNVTDLQLQLIEEFFEANPKGFIIYE